MEFNGPQSLPLSHKIKILLSNLMESSMCIDRLMRQEPVFLDIFFNLFFFSLRHAIHSRRMAKGYVILHVHGRLDAERNCNNKNTATGSICTRQPVCFEEYLFLKFVDNLLKFAIIVLFSKTNPAKLNTINVCASARFPIRWTFFSMISISP